MRRRGLVLALAALLVAPVFPGAGSVAYAEASFISNLGKSQDSKREAAQGQTRGYRPPSRAGTKAVVIHVEPSLSKSIRRLALEMDTTVQALGLEALEDLLRKHLAK